MNTHSMIRSAATVFVLALLAALALSACGSEGSGEDIDPGSTEDAPDFSQALEAAPPELAAFYEDGGTVLDGDEYESKLAQVEGYPAVINVWASWCEPCRSELPHLQDAAAEYLDEVAFVGIDVNDTDAAAETYIRDHPMPYPSFADPDYELALDIDPTLTYQPNTVFLDPEGEVVHVKYGPYTTAADLNADIEKYALSS